MSEEYIGITQEIFQNLISRPKLLDKYLLRPPFRFIHDIVMNTMKATGFPDGLFEENELNGKIIKDKHAKLSWLNKLIKCIESVHNESLNVNPNKVVSGLEPECTNEMLQIFGKIAIEVGNGQLSMQDILNNLYGNNSENTQESPHQEQQHQEQQDEKREEPQDTPQQSPIVNIDKADGHGGDNWVAQTQQTLGKLIERPRLLEKLLKRPPFRFLHDIIKSLIKSTGYPLQFLDENKDIANANIKDAKFKYYFLSKLIVIVSATINEDLSFIDPKNIIAGKQPQDTNYLLTKLGYAATVQINIDEIKKTVITISQTKKTNKNEKESTKTVEKQQKERKTESCSETATIGKNTARKNAPIMPKLQLEQLQINNVENNKATNQRMSKRQIQTKSQTQPQPQPQPQRQPPEPFQAIQKLQRPRTARRAPPKLKSNTVEVEQKEDDIKTDILIMDDIENEMEDIADIDNNIDHNNNIDVFINNNSDDLEDENDGTHGKLVRDILDAQSGIKLEATRLGTHRRGDSAKSVERNENMREMIQKLCQTCVPLGKCIDFVFEDIESINNELLKWKQQIIKNKSILIQEKEKTNQILTPLQKELQTIKEQIKDQNQLILEKKAVLLRNEAKTNDIILKRLLNE